MHRARPSSKRSWPSSTACSAAHVDEVTERAEVTFDDTVTDLAAVQSVIAELGYGSSLVGDAASPPTP